MLAEEMARVPQGHVGEIRLIRVRVEDESASTQQLRQKATLMATHSSSTMWLMSASGPYSVAL